MRRHFIALFLRFLTAIALSTGCLGASAGWAATPASAVRLQHTLPGSGSGDNFGRVSGAGDVNGDGYADFVAGAPFNDAGGSNAGLVSIYFGGPGADGVPDLSLSGAQPGDQFGYSVSGAGDMNGDGYADVIVGADGAGGTGRAYVFFGGSPMDNTADLTLIGEAASDRFGYSVSGAGDMNRDGYADVIVGALWNDFAGPDAGRAYVFYGGAVPNASSDVTLTGQAAGDDFGVSVSDAGDMNGDGYGDVIVGAMFQDTPGSNAGRAYVFYGGTPVNNVADLILNGETANDRFGESVSGAGDVNGDGYADIIVGANGHLTSASSAGRAYLYFGGPVPETSVDLVLNATATDDVFGYSVSGAGDVNRDGYADVIVGAYLSDAGGFDSGRAYVYHGGPGANDVPDQILTGAAASDFFGYRVSDAGDVNGDGFDDVLVGAPGNDAGGAEAGRAYLYDFNRYFLSSPNGGETWNVGAQKTISWRGAEPADILLSVDGGNSYQALKTDVGGSEVNSLQLLVPHTPTKFALVMIAPADASVRGEDSSDSLFTIQTSVSLLALLVSQATQGGVTISWETDPGPAELAGYRLEASMSGSPSWRTVVALTRESAVVDPSGRMDTRYRLFAVNGLGEELLLGETSIRGLAMLRARPLPLRGGSLEVEFAAAGGVGGGGARTDVAIFDVQGRLVKRLVEGILPQGSHFAAWDGRDAEGRTVPSGIYFIRAASGGESSTLRVCVLR